MTIKQITDNLFKSVDMLIEKKIKQLGFNKTIVCTIIGIENITNNNNGFISYRYLMNYSGVILTGYLSSDFSADLNSKYLESPYNKGDEVYVLVPNNDFNNKLFILGTVDKE